MSHEETTSSDVTPNAAPDSAPPPAPVETFPNGKPTVDAEGRPASPKSRLAAALLCWFIGFLGIHRFYVGKVGTGILILPLRNPVLLAKQVTAIDQISDGRVELGVAAGWYKREFDAVGVDYHQRGKIMDRNLDVLNALMTEDWVKGEYGPHVLRSARMFPKSMQKPRPPLLIGGYVDRVLKRAGAKGDGWLTYFYVPEDFTADWTRVRNFAAEAGRDPATLISCNQLPIAVGPRDRVEGPMTEWLHSDWDISSGSKSTRDSAIMGTPEECVEQLQAHVATGVDRIIFIPYRYETEQVEAIARDIITKL